MGTSSSRLQELEALVHSLQGANVQLERQLLTVGKESDATKRAEMVATMQRESEKIRKENEMHQRQLTEELQRLRGVLPATTSPTPNEAQESSPSSPLAREIDQLRARLENESPALRVTQLEQELEAARQAAESAQQERTDLLAQLEQLRCNEVEQAYKYEEVERLHQEKRKELEQLQDEAARQAKNSQEEAEVQLKKQIADLEAQLASANDGFQVKESALTLQLQSLQAEKDKVSSHQQELLLKSQSALERVQQEAATSRAERLKVGEWLIEQQNQQVACHTPQCTARIVTRQQLAASAVVAASAPGGASDTVNPDVVCVTCESAGEGSVKQLATHFCASGHAHQCDSCWEKDVHTKCDSLMSAEKPARSNNDPANALMLALPPPVLVPESDNDLQPEVTRPSEATSSGSSKRTSRKQEFKSYDEPPDFFDIFDGVPSAISRKQHSTVDIPSSTSSSSSKVAKKRIEHSQLTRRTCPSCDESYRHDRQAFPDMVPRLLQCAHTLCSACASRDLKQARLAKQLVLSCCLCHEPTFLSEIAGEALPEAEAVLELVQQLGSQTSTGATLCGECSEQEATVHCEQCADDGLVCEPCFAALHPARSKAKKDHKAVPFTADPVGVCRTHHKSLDFFCSNELCWTALCDGCRAGHGSSAPQAIIHKVEPLSEFAAKYLKQHDEKRLLTEGRAGIDELARVLRAWLGESRQAQQLGRTTQELASKQMVELVQVLHSKTRSHVQRGLIRRAAVGPLLSRFAVLHEAMRTSVQGTPLAMLRSLPALLQQWNQIKDDPAKQQMDLIALNLKLLTSFLTAVPTQASMIVTRLNELGAPPLADEMGKFVRKWGTQGSGDGQLKYPQGLAVSAGLVYVADRDNQRVQVFNAADGSFVRKWGWGTPGSGNGQLKYPQGLAVSAGLVYVADHENQRVQVFNAADGSFVRKWGSGGNGDGQLTHPEGIAVSAGLVYIAEYSNHRVQVFNAADGSFVRKWGTQGSGDGQLTHPEGIAVSAGLVYVADRDNHRVQVFNAADGSFVRKWGTQGSGDGQLNNPTGLAVSGGLAYVADCGNNRVQAFNAADGSFVRKWGSEGNGDGQLKNPTGLAVSGGLVYVADCGNHRVQVFRC